MKDPDVTNKEQVKKTLKKIRQQCDPKETKREYYKEYGRNHSSVSYFKKGGIRIARVYKTDNQIVNIIIEDHEVK